MIKEHHMNYRFLKPFCKIIVYIWAILSFAVCIGFVLLGLLGISEPIDGCMDDGGVWDNEYEVCRFDCRKWTEETGCIMLTDEELEEYVNGYCKQEGKELERCAQFSVELSKRRQWQKMKKL